MYIATMYIITGASDNHYVTLMNMINSFMKYNDRHKLIIYNLGLEETKWTHIKEKYNHQDFIFKVFDYSKYPEWFNINIQAGHYAWKPTIIYNTFLEYTDEIIVWMDAGNVINANLQELEDFIIHNYIYSATSGGTIKEWTHPLTIQYLDCINTENQNRNGACLGFHTKIGLVKDFITEFYNCALDKNCIAPEGSSRKNHRQDQSVFTILFYKYLSGQNKTYYSNNNSNYHLCYSIHNDVEPHWDT
jgi:hypothetical protein